ncbi:DNA polymerase III subunit psi [Lonepinella sp. BR2930]|uniref:DNA polymerase III subunit psi n=1 Tax=Lonepinella sp. BR2930 TaxID=3434554 RepID=UPI003F6DE4F4
MDTILNRRDLLLQQMGITQWKLRHPDTLKGLVNIQVPENIRLVIIADIPFSLNEKFMQDVLLSCEIEPNDCLFINFEQANHLNIEQEVTYWLISKNPEKIDRALPLCQHSIAQWRSPDLATLKQDPKEKRHFWQQIQTLNQP